MDIRRHRNDKSVAQLQYSNQISPGSVRRLIITHIGSTAGFLEQSLLVFEPQRTGYYYEEMDHNLL